MSELVNRHIATLLRRHDCVIVPGVGAFVAIRSNAALSSDGVFTPPCRLITFNQMINHDDGLLADSISRRLKISFEQGRERVNAESQLILRRLKAEGCVNLPYVGTLSRRTGGRLEFEPAKSWTFALPILKAVKASEPPVVEVRHSLNDEHKGVAIVRIPLQFKRVRAAAAILALIFSAFVISTPIDIHDAHNASLAPARFTPPRPVQFEEPQPPAGMELRIAMPDFRPLHAARAEAPVAPGSYIMVVASLPTMAQARQFIDCHPGIALDVAQCGDKFRVYAASGHTREQAMEQASNIGGLSAAFPDAWLCKR